MWQRESAMLALGAASEGCLEGLGPHLPALFTFLIQQQKAETPQLRSIACWVLGRFMRCVILFALRGCDFALACLYVSCVHCLVPLFYINRAKQADLSMGEIIWMLRGGPRQCFALRLTVVDRKMGTTTVVNRSGFMSALVFCRTTLGVCVD